MASSAQGESGSGGSNDHNENDLSCVYRAVDQGASAEEVRAILEGGPRTRRAKQQWLAAVLEHKGGPNKNETPLQAAHHRRRDGALVGALLEHGADAAAIGPRCSPLALAIHYGLADTLRVLLRSARHSADEQLAYHSRATIAGADGSLASCRPVHLCVVPPRLASGDASPSPRLECLDLLVREFGADVNKPDEPERRTPLQWLVQVPRSHRRRAFDALVALGADVSVPERSGTTFIFQVYDREILQQILARRRIAERCCR
jgi:hypothetical protein